MKTPCQDCNAGTWGACYHAEYGKCMNADFKEENNETSKSIIMKQYFISGHFYIPKNRAHQQIQDFARTFNHCLIDEKKLAELKSAFKAKTSEVNLLNKRCKDIDLQARSFTDKTSSFTVESNFQLTVTQVQRFELSNPTGRDPMYDLMGDMKEH